MKIAIACPVLASRISSISEMADEAALFVDSPDVEAISNGSKRLVAIAFYG
jgi:hypothetical protein